jgi:hypothetical protein
MQRHVKTSQKKRATYIYYDENRNKLIELLPSEHGVTEADIALLHSMDDAEADEQRRYDYHITEHLDVITMATAKKRATAINAWSITGQTRRLFLSPRKKTRPMRKRCSG